MLSLAKSFFVNGARAKTRREIRETAITLATSEAFKYLWEFRVSPLASKFATNETRPAEIPISAREEIMAIRLLTAEKTPKSPTLRPLAITIVNKNPKKAEATLPANRT
jgi:hypothetical protein